LQIDPRKILLAEVDAGEPEGQGLPLDQLTRVSVHLVDDRFNFGGGRQYGRRCPASFDCHKLQPRAKRTS
jgi:hypothetical protein